MSKFTAKFVREALVAPCGLYSMDDLKVVNVEGKGKNKVEKVDHEKTVYNLSCHLMAVASGIGAAMVFEAKFPEGIGEIVEEYVAEWKGLVDQFKKSYPKNYLVWSNEWASTLEGVPGFEVKETEITDELVAAAKKEIGGSAKAVQADDSDDEDESDDEDDEDEDGDDEEEGEDYSEKTKEELQELCDEREISYKKKDNEAALIAKLQAWDEEQADDEDEDGDDESDDEEGEDYSEMELSELQALCDEREISYKKKDKEEALVAKLQAWDEEQEEDGDDESDDEDDEDEDEEEEVNYSEMEREELTKLCDEREISYRKKDGTKDLVKKLEAWDKEHGDDDDEVDADELDEELEELDEILDEEFEKEVAEEEKSSKGKKGKKK